MNIEQFVGDTIEQVARGVQSAQQRIKELGGAVCPPMRGSSDNANVSAATSQPTQLIEFDIAVTVVEGSSSKGGIGVVVAAVGIGKSGEKTLNSQSVSRVKFSLPVTWPMSEEMPKRKRHPGAQVILGGGL